MPRGEGHAYDDWGLAPIEYTLDDQLAPEHQFSELKSRYQWLNHGPGTARRRSIDAAPLGDTVSGAAGPLDWLYDYIRVTEVSRIEVEPYIDLDFHDEFSGFYAYTFKPPPSRCERLHLWLDEERYLGYVSLRPIPGSPICRSLLTPAPDGGEYVTCRVQGDARPFGEERKVHGFPFLGQDSQFGRCAHSAVWMVSYYHHLANRAPRYYMSDIVRATEQHEYERVMPSAGLTDKQVGIACQRLGIPAIQYTRDNDSAHALGGDTLKALITRYLDSGIPLILCWWNGESRVKHMTVAIGYRRIDDDAIELVQHDDVDGAYSFKRLDASLDSLFVPVPERVYLPGHAAARFAEEQWESVTEDRGSARPSQHDIRTYLTHSRRYKSQLKARGAPDSMRSKFRMADLPRWIWVAEIHDAKRRRDQKHDHVVGELVIDATSDRYNPRMIIGFIPGELLEWTGMPGEPATRYATDIDHATRYLSGVGAMSADGVHSSVRLANLAPKSHARSRRPGRR